MRKMFLCSLVAIGFMNLCFGQVNTSIERIAVRHYDANGLTKQLKLRGSEAQEFDIPTYIKENKEVERLTINGIVRTDFSTTTIKFDSGESQDGDYICKEVVSELTPFLGVYGHGRRDHNGVDIKSIIPTTSAERAGMLAGEIITEFDDLVISSFPDLKDAVLSSKIGDRVELKLKSDSKEYTKQVVIGSRGIETISYKYCQEEQVELTEESKVDTDFQTSLSTYPNPTSAMSQVNYESSSDEDVIFSVTNIAGSLIYKEVFTNFDGNLKLDYNHGNNSTGTYILHIQQGKETYTRKVQLIKD